MYRNTLIREVCLTHYTPVSSGGGGIFFLTPHRLHRLFILHNFVYNIQNNILPKSVLKYAILTYFETSITAAEGHCKKLSSESVPDYWQPIENQSLKGSGNFVLDPLKKILDLAHAAMIITNLWVSQEPNDFHKPIACLIIKIFMIENRNQILRLRNGFHNTTVYWGKRVW